MNYLLSLVKKERLVLVALPDLAPSPYPVLPCLCPPTNCLATSLYSDIGLRSPSTGVTTKTDPGTSSTISHPFRSHSGRFLGGGVLLPRLGIKGPERYLAGISLWVPACLHPTWVGQSLYSLYSPCSSQPAEQCSAAPDGATTWPGISEVGRGRGWPLLDKPGISAANA